MIRLTVALILCSLVVAAESHSDQPKGTKPRRITAGDQLNISVWREPDLTMTLSVRSDGTISFPLLNELHAAGLTPDELGKVLTEKLQRYVRNPQVSVKEMYVFEMHLPDEWPLG
jgi:polysaccharide biosynthesis/export protein